MIIIAIIGNLVTKRKKTRKINVDATNKDNDEKMDLI